MSKKPMTAEAKARLKAAAEASRGRKTLAGIDPLGWAGSIDFVLSMDSIPAVDVMGDGRVLEPVTSGVGSMALPVRVGRGHMGRDREGKMARLVFCPWVRVAYTRAGQEDDLERAFGARPMYRWKSNGPGGGQTRVLCRVFPVRPVVAVFKLLWPKDYPERLRKYLTAYSEKWVEHATPKDER